MGEAWWFPFLCHREGRLGTALDFAKTAAFFIIFGFLWRYVAAQKAGTRLGAAMSFIH